MRYASTFALVAIAAGQSINDIPSCALLCITTGVQNFGCSLTDFKCSCQKANEMTPAVTSCVQSACSSTSDQQKVTTVITALCQQVGVSIPGAEGSGGSSVPAYSSGAGSGAGSTSSYVYLPPDTSLSSNTVSSATSSRATASTNASSSSSSRTATSTSGSSNSGGGSGGSGGSCAAGVTVTVTVTATCGSGGSGGGGITTTARSSPVPGISTAVSSPPFATTGSSRPASIAPSGSRISSALPPSFTGSAMGLRAPVLAGVFGLAVAVL